MGAWPLERANLPLTRKKSDQKPVQMYATGLPLSVSGPSQLLRARGVNRHEKLRVDLEPELRSR